MKAASLVLIALCAKPTLLAQNSAPTLGAITKSGTEDTTTTFAATDFTAPYNDVEGTALASITVVTLPATGTLKLGNVAVTAGQVIAAANLGTLTYAPAAHENGAKTFTVTASDGALSSAAATVTINLAAVNDAPMFFRDGSSAERAAASATEIKNWSGTNTNGVYWILVNGVATQVYCIMDSAIDGGGWMLAMKGANTGSTFNYASNHWTTTTTLNAGSAFLRGNSSTVNEDAKFDVFNYAPAEKVMAIFPDVPGANRGGAVSGQSYGFIWIENMPAPANTTSYAGRPAQGNYLGKTLRELFAGGEKIFIRDAAAASPYRAAGPGVFSTQTDVRFFGFNYQSANGSNRARFGFGWNENGGGLYPDGNEQSNDVSGGIGIDRQNWSAGDFIGCCQNSTGLNRRMQFELYVKSVASNEVVATRQVPMAVYPGLSIEDPDSATLASATVSITGGFVGSEDALDYVNAASHGNIAGSYNAATGVLTLTSAQAQATLAQWQAALRSVTYTNTSGAPNTANRTVSFVINDGLSPGPASNVTVKIALRVTYDTKGGSLLAAGTTVSGGTITSSPGSPTRSGYSFAGWALPGSPADPGSLTGLYSRFKAIDYNSSAKVWADSSGNARNITSAKIGGTPILSYSAAVNGNAVSFPVVAGGTSTSIRYTTEVLPTYTLFTVARYSGNSRGRIFNGDGQNWLAGFLSGNRGVAHFNGWLSNSSSNLGTVTHWLASTSYPSGGTSYYRADGAQRGTGGSYHNLPLLVTNTGSNAEPSDYEIAEVLIYGRVLTGNEIAEVERYIGETYRLSFASGLAQFPYAHGKSTDFTLEAVWTGNSNTVAFDSQGGSAVNSLSWPTGSQLALPTPTKSGSGLVGWYDAATGGNKVGDGGSVYLPANTAAFTLYARWGVPSLATVGPLAGGTEDTPFSVTHAALWVASDASVTSGGTPSFRIEEVTSGTLTKNGVAVTPGSTLLGPGESLLWRPAAHANGTLSAFTVKAVTPDNAVASTTAVQVSVNLAAVNDTPLLASGLVQTQRFNASGTFTPTASGTIEALIVGGGGGGAGSLGGGGGGGGVVYITAGSVVAGVSYPIVVGAGGAAGSKGQASTAFGATADGGGTSGTHDSGDGTAGGSGGGAASNNSRLNQGGASSGNSLGANTGIIYGNRGGHMTFPRSGGPTRGAGGGGAGGQGKDTNSNTLGDTGRSGDGSGGVGIANSILGTEYYWGGGGGGGAFVTQFGGYGGLGGGGGAGGNGGAGLGGGSALNSGGNGSGLHGGSGGANTGGGGGGGGWDGGQGAPGGSGVVIVRSEVPAIATRQVALAVVPGLIITDVDSSSIGSARVSITGGLVGSEDVLGYVNAASHGNIAGTYDVTTGVLTLTSAQAQATLAQWQEAFRAVTYTNNSATPNTGTRTVSFVIYDGATASAPLNITVIIGLRVTYDTKGGSLLAAGTTVSGGTITSSPGSPTRSGYSFAGWTLPGSPADPGSLTGLYSRFKAADYNAATKVWADSSGNARNITSARIGGSPTVVSSAVGNGNSVSIPALAGGTGTSIRYTTEVLPTYTLFTVARYSGNSRGRIFNGDGQNWLAGFWSGNRGVAHFNGWLSNSSSNLGTVTHWLASTSYPSGGTSYYRAGGAQRGTGGSYHNLPLLVTNTGSHAEPSDYEIAEVLIYGRVLTGNEIAEVERYLGVTYGLNVAGSFAQFPYAHGKSTDFTLEAVWSGNSNTVAFDSQGGSAVSSISWPTGSQLTLPNAPTRTGYLFNGWYSAAAGGNRVGGAGATYTPSDTASFTLYAQWNVPLLGTVSTLTGADEDTHYTITHAALLAASDASVPNNGIPSFRVDSVSTGTLTKSGAAVTAGATLLGPNESLVWRPATDANGTLDAFTVRSANSDGSQVSSLAVQVRVAVAAQNDAPVLGAITKSGTEDTTTTFAATDFTAPYNDVEGTALASITVVTLPAAGTLKLGNVAVTASQVIAAANLGTLTYEPAAHENGAKTFTVTASDGALSSAAATVTINLAAVNDAPTLGAITKSGTEDTTTTFAATDFTAPYNDVEGTALASFTVVTLPATGTLKLNGTPVVPGQVIPVSSLDVPNQGLVGRWSFDSVAELGKNAVTGAALTNSGAAGWSANGRFGGAVDLNGSSWLYASTGTIDNLPVGGSSYTVALWFKARTFGSNGFVGWGQYFAGGRVNAFRLSGSGQLVNYWWDNDLYASVGQMSPQNWYHVVATYDGSKHAIYFNGVEKSSRSRGPPNVQAVNFGIGKTVANEYFDGLIDDVLIYSRALSATEITALAGGLTAGGLVYEPAAHENGAKTFTVTASDGALSSAAATVTINLAAVNDAPTLATPAALTYTDTAATDTFTPSSGTLQGADVDTGATLSYGIANVTAANGVAAKVGTYGTLAVTPSTGAYTFTPNAAAIKALAAGASASDVFTVTVTDGVVQSPTQAALTVNIAGANDAPVLGAITKSGTEDTTTTFAATDFTAPYSDVEGMALASITVVTLPATGTLKLGNVAVTAGQVIAAANLGTLTYEPAAHENGAKTFTVTASDGALSSAAATVTINLAAVNDAPVVTTSSGSTVATVQTPVVVDPGLSVTDIDSATLASATVTISSGFQSDQDTLGFVSAGAQSHGNISASFDSATGVLTLSSAQATATLAQWQAALRVVTFSNSSSTPNVANRTIRYVVNDGGLASAAAEKTLVPDYNLPPAFITAPAPVGASQGTTTFLRALVSGWPTPTLQWRRNGVPIQGATQSVLAIHGIIPSDAGAYDLVASNVVRTVESAAVAVTVTVTPGELFGTGLSEYGSLGDLSSQGGFTRLAKPLWPASGTQEIIQVTAAGRHSLILTASGKVFGMGHNFVSALGVSSNAASYPVPELILDNVRQVAAAQDNSYFLRRDGTLWGVGTTQQGMLGEYYPGAGSAVPFPLVPGQTNIVGVWAGGAAGSGGCIYLTRDGRLFLLGGPTVYAPLLIDTGVVDAAQGAGFQLWVKTDGSLWAQGSNPFGQLGTGGTSAVVSPQRVPVDDVARVFVGPSFTFFIKRNGSLWAMGRNTSGQLGVGSAATFQANPVPVEASVSSVACGERHAIILKTDGSVFTTGNNYYGQLGDGTSDERRAPVPIASSAVAVAAGGYYSLYVAPVAPTITAQPQGGALVAGSGATLSVGATGTPVLRYQWKKDGTDLPAATTASLNLAAVTANEAGSYVVVVSNGRGSVSSTAALVTVDQSPTPPSIVTHPTGVAVKTGTSATFSVRAAGTGTLVYQWRRNEVAIAGATLASLTLPSVQFSQAGSYDVIVTNTAGNATSAPAPLTLLDILPPIITRDPVAVATTPGQRVEFSVEATGTNLRYQWRKDSVEIAGATGRIFALVAAAVTDAGAYTVEVSNELGRAGSAPAQLRVDTVQGSIKAVGPSGLLAAGGIVTLELGTSYIGTAPSQLGWTLVLPPGFSYAGGESEPEVKPTTGNTGSIDWAYVAIPAGPANFRVRIAYVAGLTGRHTLYGTVSFRAGGLPSAVTPSPVTLSRVDSPVIVRQPAPLFAVSGTPASFSVEAQGGALVYQWFRDGQLIPGATVPVLAFDRVQATDAGDYSVRVSNPVAAVDSNLAKLTVFAVVAEHRAQGPGYVEGQIVEITNTVTYSGGNALMGWQVLLPKGWTLVASSGDAGDVRPAAGSSDLLEWAWTAFPVSPVNFSYMLRVPDGFSGRADITALLTFVRNGKDGRVLAKPDPLPVDRISWHTADLDRSFTFSLFELLRVIELYNTRRGSIRTGAYLAAAGTEDGFAPDFDRASGVGVPLTAYHSADYSRDGALNLFELLRLIELYNHSANLSRTGQFHRKSGTEDGFAPGPSPTGSGVGAGN